MDKISFLDRDGVINVKANEHEYIKTWNEFRFKEGAIEGIKRLHTCGYLVIIVTNQSGIAKGMMTEKDLIEIHNKMVAALEENGAGVDAIYYCPHNANECTCRKPEIGMFLQADRDFSIDKQNSFMIGDSVTDIEAGQRYGISSYLIDSDMNLDVFLRKNVKGLLGENKNE